MPWSVSCWISWKELGIEDNTIVMYSTDNGAETFTWPEGGTTMYRGEKNTQWEGGYRVPTLIRWPGTIKPGSVINEIGAHEDMMTTLLAAAGEPNIAEELLKGKTIGNRTYKVHLDGYDLAPALKGGGEWPRKEFIYWTDDGNVAALRYENWKITFLEQKAEGMRVWQEPFDQLRAPLLTNLRMDPFELPGTKMRWAISAGGLSRCSSWRPRLPISGSGCKASVTSRRAKSPAASISTG